MHSFLKKLITLLIPVLIIGVTYGIFNYVIILSITIIYLFFINRDDIALISFLIFPKLLGFIFVYWNINIPGTIVGFIFGLLFLRIKILNVFRQYSMPFKILSCILILFYFYYFFGDNSINSTEKITNLTYGFIVNLFAVIVLINKNNVNTDNISLVYTLYSILLISFSYDLFFYQRTASFIDFDSFRDSFYLHKSSFENTISYHTVGNSALISIAFYISSIKKRDITYSGLFIISNIYLILFSGARQSLMGVIFIFLIYGYLRFKRLNILICIIVIFVLILSILLPILNIQYINELLYEQSSSSMMNRNLAYPLQVIYDNFLLGIGFGNYYNPLTGETYPHNIILEILCEMGIVAFLIILSLFVFFFSYRKVSFSNIVLGKNYAIILILPFLIRSMISDSIDSNFIVFVFVLFLLYNPKQKCNS